MCVSEEGCCSSCERAETYAHQVFVVIERTFLPYLMHMWLFTINLWLENGLYCTRKMIYAARGSIIRRV